MSPAPHIILVMTDQQRFDTICALGASHMETPNLDRLAREGVVFENCFVNAPSCVPSRASLFTGLEPHTTGILRNGQNWSRTWVRNLVDAGYHCVSVGKMHTIPYDADAGFHERFVVENKDRYFEGRWFADDLDKAFAAQNLTKPSREGYRALPDYQNRLGAVEWTLPKGLHPDVFVSETARWWLNSRPQPNQLFMQIGLPGPHPPYDPTPDYLQRYLARNDLPVPDVKEADLQGLPDYLKKKRVHDTEVDHDAVAWKIEPSHDELRRLWTHYCANVTMIDDQVGLLLDCLEDNAYLDDCVIIFISDHGDALGEHGLSQKWSMYEPVVKVPCIIWSPERFRPDVVGEKIQLFDVGATILDLAGAARSELMQARTLRCALEGEPFSGREVVFSEQAGDVSMTGARLVTMARSDRYKAVFILDAEDGQLFDLDTDPGEVVNLWDDPAHLEIREELRRAILDWRARSMLETMDLFAEAR